MLKRMRRSHMLTMKLLCSEAFNGFKEDTEKNALRRLKPPWNLQSIAKWWNLYLWMTGKEESDVLGRSSREWSWPVVTSRVCCLWTPKWDRSCSDVEQCHRSDPLAAGEPASQEGCSKEALPIPGLLAQMPVKSKSVQSADELSNRSSLNRQSDVEWGTHPMA